MHAVHVDGVHTNGKGERTRRFSQFGLQQDATWFTRCSENQIRSIVERDEISTLPHTKAARRNNDEKDGIGFQGTNNERKG